MRRQSVRTVQSCASLRRRLSFRLQRQQLSSQPAASRRHASSQPLRRPCSLPCRRDRQRVRASLRNTLRQSRAQRRNTRRPSVWWYRKLRSLSRLTAAQLLSIDRCPCALRRRCHCAIPRQTSVRTTELTPHQYQRRPKNMLSESKYCRQNHDRFP